MPYISPQIREELKPISTRPARKTGEVTFQFYSLALDYLKENGREFQAYADILAGLEACKLEIYRRQISLFEDGAIDRNGDLG